MVTPSTSLGSMSLVNCRRWKRQATARASAWASVVLPTPGTSSISRWPRASRQTSESRTTSGLPRIADPTSRFQFAQLGRGTAARIQPAGRAWIPAGSLQFMIAKPRSVLTEVDWLPWRPRGPGYRARQSTSAGTAATGSTCIQKVLPGR